jgi:hypothetical protein
LPKHPRLSRYIFTLHPSPFFFLKKNYLFIYFVRLHQNKMVLCFSITNSNNQATIQWWFVDLASSLLLLLLSRSPIATTQQPSPIILKLVERESYGNQNSHTFLVWNWRWVYVFSHHVCILAYHCLKHVDQGRGGMGCNFLVRFAFSQNMFWKCQLEEKEWVTTFLSDYCILTKPFFFFGVYWRGRRIVKTSLSRLLHSHKTMFEECVNCWGMSGCYFFITFAFLAQHVGMCLQLGGEWVTTSSHHIAFLPNMFQCAKL